MINDLKDYEAVFIPETGKYLVKLPASVPGGEYHIEGVDEPIRVQGYNGRTITIPNLDCVSRANTPAKTLLHLEDQEGEYISVEKYLDHKRNLAQYETELGTYLYPDLKTEFDVRLEIEYFNGLTRIYDEPKPVLTKVEFKQVGELADTGSKFIESSFEYGTNGFYHGTSPYRLNIAMVALDEFQQLSQKYSELSNSNHSGLRYVKYVSNYVFSDQDVANCPAINVDKGYAYRLFASLAHAKAAEDSIRKYVRTKIMLHVNASKLDDITTVEVIDGLEKLHREVGSFKLMKTSKGSKSQALSIINKLIQRIKDNNE